MTKKLNWRDENGEYQTIPENEIVVLRFYSGKIRLGIRDGSAFRSISGIWPNDRVKDWLPVSELLTWLEAN